MNRKEEIVNEECFYNSLLLHVAFVSEDPESDKVALLSAGATFIEGLRFENGSHLVLPRDPWGLAVQLCKRAVPMLKG